MTERADATAFRLIYRSHSLIPGDQRRRDLGALFSAARAHNKAVGVTGALLCSGDVFVQVLEGPEAVVSALYAHISADPRHDQVALVESGYVGPRVFSRWAMAEVGDDEHGDVPLIARTDGIAVAAGRTTTSAQEEVLDIMRDAVRDESHAS